MNLRERSKVQKNKTKLISVVKFIEEMWKGKEISDIEAETLLEKIIDMNITQNPNLKRWYSELESINRKLWLLGEEKMEQKLKKVKKKPTNKKKEPPAATVEEEPPAPAAAVEEEPPAPAAPAAAQGESKQESHSKSITMSKTEQDPFKVRIDDIKSYLDEQGIFQKKEENPEFIKHEKVILEFIRELNRKLPGSSYKLVITGGYAINLHGGKNKTSDVDMVLCHNNDVQRARGYITSQILGLMGENGMVDNPTMNKVQQLAPGTDVNDPTNPVKIRINGVQAIDITFKDNTNNFCNEIELKKGFFVLKANFMKRNLMEITNNFRKKLAEGVISHPGKLVSWRDQMTSLSGKSINPRSRTSSPTQGGVRKTRRRKKRRKKRRRKSRKKKK